MKTEISKFRVDVVRVDRVPDMPGSWTQEEYRQLLEACDFDWPIDFSDEEFGDYAVIALMDYNPEEAAAVVLKTLLGHVLNHGQIKNLAEEMKTEKTWEEYQDISLHRALFKCHLLLNQAFPKDFPDTDIARCTLEIMPQNSQAREQLENIDTGLIVRILADGMGPHSVLNRFFGKAVQTVPFKEANHLVWKYNLSHAPGSTYQLKVYGSWYWFTALLGASEYESEAYCDLQPA